MKLNYYGGINTQGIIRSADAKVFQIGGGLADSDVGLETIRVEPNPLSTIGLADSDFGFTTTILDSAS